jgi:RES domain-containing protein
VSISVWRIATDTPNYTADDLSGTGAAIEGGRWNMAGMPLVYASSSRALAALETLVHVKLGSLPHHRYLVCINIPDAIWTTARIETAASLAVGWDAVPQGAVSIDLGMVWATDHASAILRVPSVIVPEEENILINPAHPDAARISAVKVRRWLYDPRLR